MTWKTSAKMCGMKGRVSGDGKAAKNKRVPIACYVSSDEEIEHGKTRIKKLVTIPVLRKSGKFQNLKKRLNSKLSVNLFKRS